MIRPLACGIAMALFSIVNIFVVFASIHLVLFFAAGSLAISYLQTRDPYWDAGPLGGIQLLPVFFILVPFSVWLTVLTWKRIRKWLSMRYEFFRADEAALNLPFLVLTVGIFGIGIPFVRGLVSGYLHSSGIGG